MSETIARLTEIFRQVFENDALAIQRETSAKDIEGWDSLMHVTLLVNVEKDFGIRFTSTEVASLKDVGELADLVEKRRAAKS